MRTEPSFSVDPEENILSASAASDSHGFHSDSESSQLADYRQHFGLSVDPFVDDPHFPFYPGGQRRQILEQLLHLCQFSKNLLVVGGDYGVGKTRMVQALIDSLDDADDICFLEGQINSDFNSLISDASAQLELASLKNFEEFCVKKSSQEGLVILIIDNAHHLNDDTLRDLLNFYCSQLESRLRLVLFAEVLLFDRVDDFAVEGLEVSDFFLEKFSLNESADYLNFRMEMSDYLGPEIFTDAKVDAWWREANGQLLVLHERAQEQLLAAVSRPLYQSGFRNGLPMMHIAGVAALVAVLMMTGIYWGAGSKESKQAVIAVELPKPTALPANASSQTIAGHNESTVSIAQIEVAAPVSSFSSAISVEKKSEVALSTPKQSDTFSSVATSKSQEAPVAKQNVVPLVEINNVHSDTPSKLTKSSVSSVKEIKKSQSSPDASKVVAKKESADKASYSDQEKMILSWPETSFTLQLVGVSSEKAVREYLAVQPNKADLLVFKSLRNGKDWYVVVSGKYPSSAGARQAIQQLPESQKKASPWPREISAIHKDIKQGHAAD